MKLKKMVLSLLVLVFGVTLVACKEPKSVGKEQNEVEVEKKKKKQESKKSKIDAQVRADLKELEKNYESTLGIYAINTKNNQTFSYNEKERFAYVSTLKAIASGLLLKKLAESELNKKINFSEDDLVDYSPVTENYVDKGMTIKEIIHAAIAYSDNTAANLIINQLGGPNGLQKELEKIGDNISQSDRYEPELNSATPGDNRDTTTPEAFGNNLNLLLQPEFLSKENLAYFKQTLIDNTTGDKLIRDGVPKDYIVGDKTGAGSYGTRNDIAVIYPKEEDNNHFVWIIFSKKENKDDQYNDKLISDTSKILSNYFSL